MSEYTKEQLVRQLITAERAEPTTRIRRPSDTVSIFMRKLWGKEQEHFAILLLDGAHNVISCEVVTKGLVNRTLVHPREVFRPAIKKNAVAIVTGHNHPSGSVEPSDDDRRVWKAVREAGEVLGICVLDNLVVSDVGFYSEQEDG